MKLDDLLTLDEIATQFKVSKRTIRDRIKTNRLKGYKAFGKWVVFRADLENAIRKGEL